MCPMAGYALGEKQKQGPNIGSTNWPFPSICWEGMSLEEVVEKGFLINVVCQRKRYNQNETKSSHSASLAGPRMRVGPVICIRAT